MEPKKIRVRFAPSPTGPLHIGGVRTALYNYLFAKQFGGDFILRIEDTDQARYVSGAEDYIINALKWCGIMADESPLAGGDFGPYRQSERKDIYTKYAHQLVQQGNAYYAFDSPEDLNAKRDATNWQYDSSTRESMHNSLTVSTTETEQLLNGPYVIRIKIPSNQIIQVNDHIRGEVNVNSNELDDKVIFKSDGMPTYHLANVVDDHLMKITHVIRGEEWLPSAPLHVLLYQYLGWEETMPEFAHLPLLLKPDGNGKLSKRDGDRLGFPVFPLAWKDQKSGEQLMGYREEGYFPEAFINMLAFLGWNPGTEKEIYSLEELIADFNLEQVGKSGAKFNIDKARWFNQQYLVSADDQDLANSLNLDYHSTLDLKKICGLMKERVQFTHEIMEQGRYFFKAPTSYDPKTRKKRWKEQSPSIVKGLIKEFKALDNFKSSTAETAFKNYIESNEIGFGAAMISLRLVITGVGGGPELFEIMEIIGKEETLHRMEHGIEALAKPIEA